MFVPIAGSRIQIPTQKWEEVDSWNSHPPLCRHLSFTNFLLQFLWGSSEREINKRVSVARNAEVCWEPQSAPSVFQATWKTNSTMKGSYCSCLWTVQSHVGVGTLDYSYFQSLPSEMWPMDSEQSNILIPRTVVLAMWLAWLMRYQWMRHEKKF